MEAFKHNLQACNECDECDECDQVTALKGRKADANHEPDRSGDPGTNPTQVAPNLLDPGEMLRQTSPSYRTSMNLPVLDGLESGERKAFQSGRWSPVHLPLLDKTKAINYQRLLLAAPYPHLYLVVGSIAPRRLLGRLAVQYRTGATIESQIYNGVSCCVQQIRHETCTALVTVPVERGGADLLGKAHAGLPVYIPSFKNSARSVAASFQIPNVPLLKPSTNVARPDGHTGTALQAFYCDLASKVLEIQAKAPHPAKTDYLKVAYKWVASGAMAEENKTSVRSTKKLVIAMAELDGAVVAVAQKTIRTIYPPQPLDAIEVYINDLQDASKPCEESNYNYESMMQYLSGSPSDIDAWTITLAFIEEKFLQTTDIMKTVWRSRINLIQKAAVQVVLAAFEAPQLFNAEESVIVIAMMKKFKILDTFLEDIPEFIKERDDMMGSFSDELEDRLNAVIYLQDLGKVGPQAGRYQPNVTPKEYEEALEKVRQRRKSKHTPGNPATPIPPFQDKTPTNITTAYDQKSNKWNPTITALVSILVFLAGIPGAIAWKQSPHLAGRRSDADFWFLIQNSILQVVGLLTIVASLLTRSRLPRQPWFWTWGFVGMSSACALAAIPLYLVVPTEWSATVSFAGSAAQAFVVL
ncbi:hypothetical protein B7463_g5999, partial [Scytalidium lignicola]